MAAWCLLDSFTEVEGLLFDSPLSIRDEEEGHVAELSNLELVGLGLGEGVLFSLLDGCFHNVLVLERREPINGLPELLWACFVTVFRVALCG